MNLSLDLGLFADRWSMFCMDLCSVGPWSMECTGADLLRLSSISHCLSVS